MRIRIFSLVEISFLFFFLISGLYSETPQLENTNESSVAPTSAGYSGELSINLTSSFSPHVDELMFEHAVNNFSSVLVGVDFREMGSNGAEDAFSTYSLTGIYNWYPWKNTLSGFYIGLGASISTYDQAYDTLLGPAGDVGYQWILFKAWAINLGVSYTYNIAPMDELALIDQSGGVGAAFLATGFAWR